MRQLKHHERKLLRKVDFLQWKSDQTLHEIKVMRRYHVQNRDDYVKYNRICGSIQKLAHKIIELPQNDAYRTEAADKLLEKLFHMGIISQKGALSVCEKVTVSAFCRRRLGVVMCRLKMAQTVKEAVTYIEQGHVRVGPETITDPAFLVTRNMEDFVTWVHGSSIKRKIMKYHDKLDDFELLD